MRGFNPKISSNKSCASKKDIDPKKLETVDAKDGDPNNLLILGVTGTVDREIGVLVPGSLPPSPLSESLSFFALLPNSSF